MYGDDEVQVLGGCSGSAARLRAELRGELASGTVAGRRCGRRLPRLVWVMSTAGGVISADFQIFRSSSLRQT